MRTLTLTLLAAAVAFTLGCTKEEPSAADSSTATHDSQLASATETPMTSPQPAASQAQNALLDFTMPALDGKPMNLEQYRGKVVIFVNTASKCGYTPQYAGLEKLYEKYKDQGLVIIGVPANNFGGQEPGTNEQIAEFCTANYGVTFPMLSKVSVKGPDMCPLYHALIAASASTGETGDVGWNFEKFVLDRNANLIARYRSKTTPEDPKLIATIESALDTN